MAKKVKQITETQFRVGMVDNNLELIHKNAETLESKGILEQIQLHDPRKADRIYENLRGN